LPYKLEQGCFIDNQTDITFVYFGQTVAAIHVWPEGYFYLNLDTLTSNQYHIQPFQYFPPSNSFGGSFYFNQVENINDLDSVTVRIKLAFPAYYSFKATTTYVITWVYNNNSKSTESTLLQVVLSTDMKSSFMIVCYAQLNVPSDTNTAFYIDTYWQKNTFRVSTNDSNCNVPGQFIFQLNNIEPKMKGFEKMLYIINSLF
jgi:hypothetical protein